MMRWRCRGYRALAVDCADGCLSGRQRERLERHLARCPACAEEMEGLRQLPVVLKTAAVPDPGEDFWRQQRQAIGRAIRHLPEPAAEQEAASWLAALQRTVWRFPLAAAAALLLAIVSYRLVERPPLPQPSEDVASAVAALDPRSLVALNDQIASLVPQDDALASASPGVGVTLAELPAEDVMDPGFLPDAPQATDLTDEELEGVGNLVGGIA